MPSPLAVHFGAGSHGRAFNGLILSNAGYSLTIVDPDEHIAEVLQSLKGYGQPGLWMVMGPIRHFTGHPTCQSIINR